MAKSKEAVEGQKKRSVIVPIIIIIIVILGSVGGAIAIDKFMHKEPQSAIAQSESQALASKVVMMPLSTFTVNLAHPQGDNTDHYIKISLSLSVTDDKAQAALKKNLPIIRDSVITVLSQKTQNDIISNTTNLQTLKNQIKNAINNNVGVPAVNDVYITDMVLQ